MGAFVLYGSHCRIPGSIRPMMSKVREVWSMCVECSRDGIGAHASDLNGSALHDVIEEVSMWMPLSIVAM